ncbi:uncharacterized protein EAE98_007041 [Botrytis deweyae]|uniref:Rhodopsin domain-containing protein n=1 Tax=Botrytis deweyae TaxID=2478750 RepID=A0ABQ7IIB5_9HELO|nr:uncharacterized protein EAE98_007041 [Botrytis deweyae]KAF7924953.1 hypothetical protein EAE98_007041 [Botrytis deweyae]
MAFIDLVLAIVPVHMIWKLQMNKRKKVAICILLSTGVSAFGFAVIKIVELKNDANHSDITCKYEINLIIIAACIPTLIPLLEIILNHRIASYFNSYKTNRGGSKFSFHKESFRMRRLNSANNDTESGKDILGIKNSINGNSGELGVVEESEEIRGNENTDRIMSQGKIAVTRQWSVTELKY